MLAVSFCCLRCVLSRISSVRCALNARRIALKTHCLVWCASCQDAPTWPMPSKGVRLAKTQCHSTTIVSRTIIIQDPSKWVLNARPTALNARPTALDARPIALQSTLKCKTHFLECKTHYLALQDSSGVHVWACRTLALPCMHWPALH